MNLINYGHRDFKSIYHAAIRGAYFGILNAFFVFFPFLYSLTGHIVKFSVYSGVALLMAATLAVIVTAYRKKYNYNVVYLRYLLFTGSFHLVFYFGYIYSLYRSLNVRIFTFDAYILLLYLVLSLMSAFDILSCAFKGYQKIRRFYTRTYQRQTATNVILLVMGVTFGILLLLPQYLL